MTMSAFGLRNPSNIVPASALNVFPHVLRRYRCRFLPWLSMLPCPTFPLALQCLFGQNTSDAFHCSVLFFFICTAYKRMLSFHHGCDFPPPVRGVLPPSHVVLPQWGRR